MVARCFGLICALASEWALAANSGDPVAINDADTWRGAAIERALQSTTAVTDPYRRAQVLADVAKAQASDSEAAANHTLQAALAAANQIAEPTFQGWALQEIALAQIAADDAIGARQTADRIRSERPQGAAFAAIALLQLRGGNLQAARNTVARITDSEAAGPVQRQIVMAQIGAGSLSAARATALSIDENFSQALALGDVAAVDVRTGNVAAANALAGAARKAYRGQVYGRTALARVDAGDLNGALATLAKIDDPLDRALLRARIGGQRAAAGDSAQAKQLFADAVTGVQQSRDRDHGKALAWARLARVEFNAGELSGARECLRQAIAAVAAVPAGPQRNETLDAIARTQARMGDSDAALVTATEVNDRIIQALLIRDIVASQPGID
ncbi:MAG TPA: hypothetical protein VKB34_20055, partial [Povalibacter sp.]|nr:hypothetical protein [Povalibacter sp.]